MKPLAKAILALQQADGGWSQRAGLPTDAQATGESLFALAKTSVLPISDPAYRQGVKFLLNTQAPDGSWHVLSRAPKIQVYFNSGFPYGGDQWISTWGTAWETMALIQSVGMSAR